MKAFHSTWTGPFAARNPGADYVIEPFELLTTMLSALEWRAAGGSISMITDARGATYYCKAGLSSLWDGGILPLLEGAISPRIPPHAFWAAGKIFSLRAMAAPCVMLDTDFIVWKDITPLCGDADVAVIHREEIYPDIYPDASNFRLTEGFDLSVLDWNIPPCNTALTYFRDDAFKSYYTEQSIAFMRHAPEADDPLTYMVFAEQRLLAMCASAYGARLVSFSSLPELICGGQQYFTHIWGAKQAMRDHPLAGNAFCKRCAARLQSDFPDWARRAAAIPTLHKFFPER